MWIAATLLPLVFLVNAYFIGRLIKRIKVSSDGCLNFILGFFSFLAIFYLFAVLLYSLRAPVWGYGITYIVIQVILLGAYIFNWKYLIFKPTFNARKVISFVIIFIVVGGLWYLSYRDIGSMFGQYWIKTIVDIEPSWDNIIIFDSDVLIINFSVMNIFNIFVANVLKISKASQILGFASVAWTFMASVIFSLIAAWIIDETKSIARISLVILSVIFLVVVDLAFIETFAIPDAWLIIELTVYILVLLSRKNYGPMKLISLTIILMAMVGTTSNAYFLAIALFIFTVYWAVRNYENSISYIIFLLWPVINAIGGFASWNARYLLLVMNGVYTIIALIRIIIFARIGMPSWEIKVAKGISKYSAKIVYTFLGLFIALILVSNLVIFYDKYKFDFSKIDYKNFLTFIYRVIWNIRIDNDVSIAVINSLLYALFLSFIIAFIVLRKSKKNKGYWFTKDVAVKIGVVAAGLFCNPLSIHVFNVATRDYSLNTSNMNALLLVPFVVFAIQAVFNYKKYTIDKWNYYWI